MLALEGQSLKYSREHVEYLHFVRRLVALSFRQDRGFDPPGSRQLPIVRSD